MRIIVMLVAAIFTIGGLTACGGEEVPSVPPTSAAVSAEDQFINAYDAKVVENQRPDWTSSVRGRKVLLDTAYAACRIFDEYGANSTTIVEMANTMEGEGVPPEAWAPIITGATLYFCPEHNANLTDWINQ